MDEKKEKQREYQKKYTQANPEKIKEIQKKYREENKERLREYQKKYRQENAEKLRGYFKSRQLKERIETDPDPSILEKTRTTRTIGVRLPKETVFEIYTKKSKGETNTSIARELSLHIDTVTRIINGKRTIYDDYRKEFLKGRKSLFRVSKLQNSFDIEKIWEKKLTRKDVIRIIERYISGEAVIDISKSFPNIHIHTIYNIFTFYSWKRISKKYEKEIIDEKNRRSRQLSKPKKRATRKIANEQINYPVPLCPICSIPYPCKHTK